MAKSGLSLMLFTGLVLGWNLPAFAQSSATPFKYQITPYVWFSGLNGTLGARGRTADVDASLKDILDNLDLAAMGSFEGRWNRWRVLVDTQYIKVSAVRGTPGPVFTDVGVGAKTFILDPELGYSVLRNDRAELEVLGGVRYWHLKNELTLSRGSVERIDVDHSRGWVDPIVGGRFRWDFSKSIYATARADIGWQAFGGVGMKFNDRLSGTVGYRYMAVNYKTDGFVYDTSMQGLIIGLGIHF
jgi:hypothetical protein